MACEKCTWNLRDFLALCAREDDLLEWLRNHGALRRELQCGKCGSECTLKSDFRFVCGKTSVVRRDHKVKKTRCNFSQSARKGTWFAMSRLPIKTICEFTAFWAILRPPRTTFLQEEFSMSENTVVDWSNFCRELCVDWCFEHKEKIGGVGVVVEIDDAKLGEGKVNHGRTVEGQCVFGGVERESKKMFLVAVPDCTAATLLTVLKEWVSPGTTIVSGCFKAFDCLRDTGYEQFKVSHKVDFLDPGSGGQTQNIYRAWREVKSSVPRCGRSKDHYAGYLCEFLWKRSLPNFTERLHFLFGQLIGKSSSFDLSAAVVAETSDNGCKSGEFSD